MMRRIWPLYFTVLLLVSCEPTQKFEERDGFAVAPPAGDRERTAVFAGGCFWATQECMRQLKGVSTVLSGYAGGGVSRPVYEDVLSGRARHAESVLVYYDPSKISYTQLAKAFFASHDPTQVDRQGPDVGQGYRSAAFFSSPAEANILRKIRDSLDNSGKLTAPVATEIMPLDKFFPAEMYHQDYYRQHPLEPYIRRVSKPKVEKLRKTFPDLVKNGS